MDKSLIQKIERRLREQRAAINKAETACDKAFAELYAVADGEKAERVAKIILYKIIRQEMFDGKNS